MNWTPKTMGSKGGKALKHLSAEERQRRADWARGLEQRRKAKRATASQAVCYTEKERPMLNLPVSPILSRFIVIDRRGQRWPYAAETIQDAITKARFDGIDAIGARPERGENRQ